MLPRRRTRSSRRSCSLAKQDKERAEARIKKAARSHAADSEEEGYTDKRQRAGQKRFK